jgi:6-phosphogluconolactonase (cycloisomerase 2 family)
VRRLTIALMLTLVFALAGVRHALAINPTPSVVSVSPNTGPPFSANQAFTFTYSHPAGYTNLIWVYGLFTSNQQFTVVNACYFYYNVSTHILYLVGNTGSAVAGTVNLGPSPSGTAANTQCTITAAGSSVSGAGNNLTLKVSMHFLPAFAGQKKIYGRADASGSSSGWVQLGNWAQALATAANATPQVMANHAGGGAAPGSAKTFSLSYTDAQGYPDMTFLYFHFSNGTVPSCYGSYGVDSDSLFLATDAGNAPVGSIKAGSGTLSNSQCTINGANSSVSKSGQTITLNVNITFKTSFTGTKTLWMRGDESAGFSSGWIARGNWTILGNIYSYVADTAGNNIYGFSMNPSTGALTSFSSNPIATGSEPGVLVADLTGHFLYEVNAGDGRVNGYRISSTGALSAIALSFPTIADFVYRGAIDSWGKYLYLATTGGIYAYSIDQATGRLVAISGSPFRSTKGAGSAFFFALAIDPSGKYLYADGALNQIAGFCINRTSGALTELSSSPYRVTKAGFSMAIDPSGQFLYFAGSTGNVIHAFSINVLNGALTAISGSPYTLTGVSGLSVDPAGRYLYATTTGARIQGFTINSTTGALTGLGAFTTRASIYELAADPTAQFMLGTNGGSQSALRISGSPAGALSEVAGSPLNVGGTTSSYGNSGIAVVAAH